MAFNFNQFMGGGGNLQQLLKMLQKQGMDSFSFSGSGQAFNPYSKKLNGLIGQQEKFISGLSPYGGGGVAAPQMSAEFTKTLADLLEGGGKVDVAGIGEAARMEADRMFRDIHQGLQEKGAAGMLGGAGSSAQTAAIARALGDVSSRVSEETLRAQVGAEENAQMRRLQALMPELERAGLDLQAQGMNMQDKQFGYMSGVHQANAGQALIDALLSGNSTFGISGGFAQPKMAGGPGGGAGGAGAQNPMDMINALLGKFKPMTPSLIPEKAYGGMWGTGGYSQELHKMTNKQIKDSAAQYNTTAYNDLLKMIMGMVG